jgi:hypothetical protein
MDMANIPRKILLIAVCMILAGLQFPARTQGKKGNVSWKIQSLIARPR